MYMHRYRHYRNLRSKVQPKALQEYVTEEEFHKAQAYGLDKTRFGFVESLYNEIISTLTLTLNLLPWLWGVSGVVLFKLTGYDSEYEVRG
jgi:STE24 endopeptidase